MSINWDRVYLAYDLAKEWQILLAGLLVFFAALIVAGATMRAAKLRGRPEAKAQLQLDMRVAPAPASIPVSAVASSELLSSLEQLRSLIRSALGSLPQTSEKPGEKENSPAYFLCQRILHLRLDQMPSPAGGAAQDGLSALLKQLHALRAHLKKGASPAELSEILVQINTSARNLVAALAPAAEKRRQVDTR